MNRRSSFTAGLLLAALAATTTACGINQGQAASRTPTPSSTSAAPTPSATPSTTALSPGEQDAQAAEQAVVTFWKRVDQFSSDPSTDLTNLAEVARGETVDVWQRMLLRQRAQRYVQRGATRVESVQASENAEGQWSTVACVDVSKVTVVDENGQSVVDPDGASRIEYEYIVEKDGQDFYVLQDEAKAEC